MAGRFILLAVWNNGAANGVGRRGTDHWHPATDCGGTRYTSAHEMKARISPGGNQKCDKGGLSGYGPLQPMLVAGDVHKARQVLAELKTITKE